MGDAFVIITSKKESVHNSTHDEVIFDLAKKSKILSKIYYYIKEYLMVEMDFFIYGFMALLANDFMKEFRDMDDYTLLLNYIASGIEYYYQSEKFVSNDEIFLIIQY